MRKIGLVLFTLLAGYSAFHLHYVYSIQFSGFILANMLSLFEHTHWFIQLYPWLISLIGEQGFQLFLYFISSIFIAAILGFSLGLLIKNKGYFCLYSAATVLPIVVASFIYIPTVMSASGYNNGMLMSFDVAGADLILQMLVLLPTLLFFSYVATVVRQKMLALPVVQRIAHYNPDMVLRA